MCSFHVKDSQASIITRCTTFFYEIPKTISAKWGPTYTLRLSPNKIHRAQLIVLDWLLFVVHLITAGWLRLLKTCVPRLALIDFHSLNSILWVCEMREREAELILGVYWKRLQYPTRSIASEGYLNAFGFCYSGHSKQFSQGIKAHSEVCFCLWPCIRLPTVAIPFPDPSIAATLQLIFNLQSEF